MYGSGAPNKLSCGSGYCCEYRTPNAPSFHHSSELFVNGGAVKVEGSDTEVVKVATRKPVALAKPPSKKAPTKKAPAAKPPAKKKLSLVR